MLEPIRPHILTIMIYVVGFTAFSIVLDMAVLIVKAAITKHIRQYRLLLRIDLLLIVATAVIILIAAAMAHGQLISIPHRRAVIIIGALVSAARPTHRLLVWILFDIDEEEYYEKRG